jgi:hypothetical protein
LVIGVVVAAADIATATPGVWHLVPRIVEPPLFLAPLPVAVLSLVFTYAARLRGEIGATRIKAWFTSALIAFVYAFGIIWNLIFPMRIY